MKLGIFHTWIVDLNLGSHVAMLSKIARKRCPTTWNHIGPGTNTFTRMFEPRHNILSNNRPNVRKYVVTWLEHSRECNRAVPGPLLAELTSIYDRVCVFSERVIFVQAHFTVPHSPSTKRFSVLFLFAE